MPANSFLKTFFKGGLWALLVRSFTALSNLALSMILARLLAPDQVGIYFLLVSLVSVLVSVVLLGLDVVVVRLIARSRATDEGREVRDTVVKSTIVALASSLAAATLLYLVGFGFLAEHVFRVDAIADYRALVALWLVLWSLESLNAEFFRGFKQFHLAVLFKRLAPNATILIISSTALALSIEVDLQDYLGIVLFGWLFAVSLSSFLLRRRFLRDTPREPVSYGSVLGASLPLWPTAAITFALPQMDLWVVAALGSPETAALYGAAARLILIVAMPLLIVQSVVPPLIAESWAKGEKAELESGLQAVSALAFFPGLAICAVYLLAGDSILQLVFGEYYAEAATILGILTVGVVFRLFSASSQSLLTMTGHGKAATVIAIVSGVLMVAGAIALGREYGAEGVATAATAAIALHNVLNLVFARVYTGLWAYPVFRWSKMKEMLAR